MKCWNFNLQNVIVVSFLHAVLVDASGLLLLYRPRDISNECLMSHHLRYDISFGHGMSDTITLVLRTLSEVDYECLIEIVTDSIDTFLLVVIRFPNGIGTNCYMNADAFTVLKKNKCLRICEYIEGRDTNSPYFIITVKQRLRFRFLSNSSINLDMKANFYQVTATSARLKPKSGCNIKNETKCVISDDHYCFTSGVVCDGIKNCGVADWFDERKSDCDEPVRRIGYAPVVAVVAVIACVLLAGVHLMMRWLPLVANSFFIFNANEDNRLCIDPVFTTPDCPPIDIEKAKRISIIPVTSSSSEHSSEASECSEVDGFTEQPRAVKSEIEIDDKSRRKNTIRIMTDMFHQRLKSVTGRSRRESIKTDITTPNDVL